MVGKIVQHFMLSALVFALVAAAAIAAPALKRFDGQATADPLSQSIVMSMADTSLLPLALAGEKDAAIMSGCISGAFCTMVSSTGCFTNALDKGALIYLQQSSCLTLEYLAFSADARSLTPHSLLKPPRT